MSETKTTVGASVWRNVFSGRSVQKGSTEELLSKVPAFKMLSPRELKEVASIVHKREYRSGEPVFYQGDPGLGMYIIQEGTVSITIAGKDGEQQELVTLSEGDFFGELALLDESPRSANALCKDDCALIGFFRPDLFDLIEKKSSLGIKIVLQLAEIVAMRLRNTDKEVSKLKATIEKLEADAAEHREKSGSGDE